MSSQAERKFLDQMVTAWSPSDTRHSLDTTAETDNERLCAGLHREVNMYFMFVFLYNTMLALLGLATTVLLIWLFWKLAHDNNIDTALKAGGAVVTGSAAGFLVKQAKRAQENLNAARKGLSQYGCTSKG